MGRLVEIPTIQIQRLIDRVEERVESREVARRSVRHKYSNGRIRLRVEKQGSIGDRILIIRDQ